MTYQRNIVCYCLALVLLAEDPLDDVLPDKIVRVEVDADHDARDQHHNRSLNHLRLARPLDLLELSPRLADEVEDPAEEPAPALSRLWFGRTLAAVSLAVRGRLVGTTRRCAFLFRARCAALRPRLASH